MNGGVSVRFSSHFSIFSLLCSLTRSQASFSLSQSHFSPVCSSMKAMHAFISSTAYSWVSSRVHRSGIFSGKVGRLKRRSCMVVVIMLPSHGMLQEMKQQPTFGKSSSMAMPASSDGSGHTSAGRP